MNDGFDPFADDGGENTETSPPEVAASGKRPCPVCERLVTWTKGSPPRPYQHKNLSTNVTCPGVVPTNEPAGQDPNAAQAPTTPAPAAAGAQPTQAQIQAKAMFPKVIESFVATRDKIAELNAELKEQVSELIDQQKKKEAWLQGNLNTLGVESMKTAEGTAFLKKGDSATVADREIFMEFMIGNALKDALAQSGGAVTVPDQDAFVALLAQSGAWNFLTNAISKKEVQSAITAETPDPPPGVNYSTFQTLQVNRPTKSK